MLYLGNVLLRYIVIILQSSSIFQFSLNIKFNVIKMLTGQ